MVALKLETTSPTPIYLQIMEQVRRRIAAGLLKADEEMPSVRALATKHLINPNTVARAYLELEREGLLLKKRGSGTYVSPQATRLGQEDRAQIIEDLIDKALVAASEFGLTADQFRLLVEGRLKEFGVHTVSETDIPGG